MTIHSRLKTCVTDEAGFGLVETLIALTIFVIGLVAVSGLTLASADQARIANWRGQQGTAAQIMLEDIQKDGWALAASGTDTVVVGGHAYPMAISVTSVSTRVKQVTVTVAAVGDIGSITYTAHLYKPQPLPDPLPAP